MDISSDSQPDAVDAILEKLFTRRVLFGLFVAYVVVYATYTVAWMWFGSLPKAGLFGDMFGLLNAFASGIAMFGVIAAILLQRQQNKMQSLELALQRQELAETRKELKGQRLAQEALNTHAATQADVAVSQLKSANRDHIQRNKPVVFCDREEFEQDGFYYVIRNVGGGFAINVYFVFEDDAEGTPPLALGSIAANDKQPLPVKVNQRLVDADHGLRFVIICEGQFTRTTQWTPTLNFRTATNDIRRGQVQHRFPEVKNRPPRGVPQLLRVFLNNNRADLSVELARFGTSAAED